MDEMTVVEVKVTLLVDGRIPGKYPLPSDSPEDMARRLVLESLPALTDQWSWEYKYVIPTAVEVERSERVSAWEPLSV